MFNLEWSLFARVRRQAKLSKRDAISCLCCCLHGMSVSPILRGPSLFQTFWMTESALDKSAHVLMNVDSWLRNPMHVPCVHLSI
jgi:hypothetical protein